MRRDNEKEKREVRGFRRKRREREERNWRDTLLRRGKSDAEYNIATP